ncbi:RNA polymerase sigma factor [Chloroflexi bacterium TSY]|nr:RNA polymerase sigma factor [Chloroflexi bacterium TSY]
MPQTATLHATAFESLIFNERERLVRLCAHLVGESRAAEDLAQETLLVAWNKRNQITDPSGVSYWLTAIARNVCRHWARSRQREQKHMTDVDPHSFDFASNAEGLPESGFADDLEASNAGGVQHMIGEKPSIEADEGFNFELDLEREELALLLDRAMSLLPPETRALLIQHYIEEQPQTELATQTGLTKSALSVRLHRGKLALQRILTSELSDEAIAFGLVTPEVVRWQETRIWCWNCGQHRFLGQLDPVEGGLRLLCPGCANGPDDDTITCSATEHLQGLKAYKPAYSRLLKWIHHYYIEQAENGVVPCRFCGRKLKICLGEPPGYADRTNAIYVWCDKCDRRPSAESWYSLSNSLPQVNRFWKEHPRMLALPAQPLKFAGSSAIQMIYESVPDQAQIEVIFSTDTFEVMHIEG